MGRLTTSALASEVIIHVEMLDACAASQQAAVGLVGVNFIYDALELPQGSHRLDSETYGWA
jgi:hypothetical protein